MAMIEPSVELIQLCQSTLQLLPRSAEVLLDDDASYPDRIAAVDRLVEQVWDQAMAADANLAAQPDDVARKRCLVSLFPMVAKDRTAQVDRVMHETEMLMGKDGNLFQAIAFYLFPYLQLCREKFTVAWRSFFQPDESLRYPDLRGEIDPDLLSRIDAIPEGPSRFACPDGTRRQDALRRSGFDVMFDFVEPLIRKNVPNAEQLTEDQLRKLVVMGLTSFVPPGQITPADMEYLFALVSATLDEVFAVG